MLAATKTRETHQRKMRPEQDTLTEAWLTVVPDILNSTNMSYTNFRERLLLYLRLDPLGLHDNCDG